jgi:NADPH-dependent 2,4-dienoyl-CoA reductase/sulfur reductase-like enzyme
VKGNDFTQITMTIITEDPLNAAPRSGIKALIAGAGIAGLLCALECHRNGIDVILLERQPSHSPAGKHLGSI